MRHSSLDGASNPATNDTSPYKLNTKRSFLCVHPTHLLCVCCSRRQGWKEGRKERRKETRESFGWDEEKKVKKQKRKRNKVSLLPPSRELGSRS